jgi:hypothetical protein
MVGCRSEIHNMLHVGLRSPIRQLRAQLNRNENRCGTSVPLALFYHSARITWQQPLRDLGELPATLVLDRRIENPHDVHSAIGGYRRLRFVARHQV